MTGHMALVDEPALGGDVGCSVAVLEKELG
jgi:hypothetical protein